MSEYWKSTPKYWCKFCKAYIRDTKLDRTQHEATPRHQSSIQKSLKDLHKTKEREDREAQRAKDEVARLNGLSGTGSSGSGRGAGVVAKSGPTFTRETKKVVNSVEDRRRQMAQLAALGVAVPEEFRGGVAMAGDWTTVSRRTVESDPKSLVKAGGGASDNKDRKRKVDDREEDVEEIAVNRKGWGRALKNFPVGRKGVDDLDDILGGPILLKKEQEGGGMEEDVEPEEVKDENDPAVKDEPTETTTLPEQPSTIKTDAKDAITANESSATPVVFKKRKVKPIKGTGVP